MLYRNTDLCSFFSLDERLSNNAQSLESTRRMIELCEGVRILITHMHLNIIYINTRTHKYIRILLLQAALRDSFAHIYYILCFTV